ncbi:hypothetical protein F5882DRAFT_367736 [Hyaloscypha sp. PMI_1271]|nr:hypothetical protein F5882DRAFT_367736 [Hyaloscypha sp. PMI_1271]
MYSRRACDSCRRRKVKCDVTNPCSSCRISQLSCIYSHLARRRGPRVSKRAPESDISQGEQEEEGVAFSRTIIEEATLLCRQPLSRLRRYESGAVRGNSAGSPTVPLVAELSIGYSSNDIHTWLLTSVETVLALGDSAATTTILDVVQNCIDLFFQYMFPNTPIAHEGILRAAASIFLPENHPTLSGIDILPNSHANTSYAKSFTLTTALCAFVTSVMPESLLPNRNLLASPFLQSSKAMLRLYEDYDLEQPDSTSLTIRIWQSGALQNSTGRREGAWHIHSEASLLALRLRLYDETAVRHDSKAESRLLRMNFWLLYSADKAAAALESRLSVLSETLFEDNLTLLENYDDDEPLLDEAKNSVQGDLERRIAAGFHLKTQVWAAGARVIIEIKALLRLQKRLGWVAEKKDAEIMLISQANIYFSTLIHKLPAWLQRPEIIDNDDAAAATYQKTCFWVQKSNIMTVHHCLKLIILQKCIENDMLEVLGLTRQPLSWAMRKVEIVQDFINELQMVPFICYKVQGEAGVERIRHVASILLELVQNVENDTLRDRVRSQLEQILDFLARLDSKASDALSKGQQ